MKNTNTYIALFWKICQCICLTCLFHAGYAQHLFAPSAKILDTLQQKGPILYTLLGNDSSRYIPAPKMLQLIDSPLVVKDTKGNTYRVTSFDFGYRHFDTTFNDSTEQFEIVPEYFGFTFFQNRIDSLWRSSVKQLLHAGEMIYFDNIIAEDSSGIKYGAPPLHIHVSDTMIQH